MTHRSAPASPWEGLMAELASTAALFDRSIRLWSDGYSRKGGKIFCGKGCSGCCNLAVNCTLTEAAAIAGRLTDAQAEKVYRRVEILQEKVTRFADLPSFLRFHRKELGGCPFLDGAGACGVYDVRPLSCRSLLATKESRWCSVDFAELSAEEKQSFVASLDTTVAAFPMHYVAAMQDLGRELEQMTAQRLAATIGFALYGNVQVLVWLEHAHRITETAVQGERAVHDLLSREKVRHPYLVTLDTLE